MFGVQGFACCPEADVCVTSKGSKYPIIIHMLLLCIHNPPKISRNVDSSQGLYEGLYRGFL